MGIICNLYGKGINSTYKDIKLIFMFLKRLFVTSVVKDSGSQ